MDKLEWRVNTPGLLKEMVEYTHEGGALAAPINIFRMILIEVAKRAIELDDPEMNKLMIRLSLYSIADPRSPEFDLKKCTKYLES